jgi:hypothetical protein
MMQLLSQAICISLQNLWPGSFDRKYQKWKNHEAQILINKMSMVETRKRFNHKKKFQKKK